MSQLDDYDVPITEQRMGLTISLCSNSNHLISLTPRTASNFRHLLSCGTIVSMQDNTITVIHGTGSKTFYLFGVCGCSFV